MFSASYKPAPEPSRTLDCSQSQQHIKFVFVLNVSLLTMALAAWLLVKAWNNCKNHSLTWRPWSQSCLSSTLPVDSDRGETMLFRAVIQPLFFSESSNIRRTRLKTSWRRKSNIKQLKSQMFLSGRRGNTGVKVQRFFIQKLQFLRSDSEPAGDVEAQLDAFTESVSVSLSYMMLYHTSVLIFHHIMTLVYLRMYVTLHS